MGSLEMLDKLDEVAAGQSTATLARLGPKTMFPILYPAWPMAPCCLPVTGASDPDVPRAFPKCLPVDPCGATDSQGWCNM